MGVPLDVRRIFQECDVERKGYLNNDEKACFWLSTKLVGWSLAEALTLENVEEQYAKTLALHTKCLALVARTDQAKLIHLLNLSLTPEEIEEIFRWVHSFSAG